MADFEIAVNLVLKHEGGYTAGLPNDPGGETNFGITKKFYPALDIKNLTVQQAKDIYFKDYWKPFMEQEIDQRLANCALDCAVNQGPGTAYRLYMLSTPDLHRFQLERLLRYAGSSNNQFYRSWFSRVLDV